MSKVIKLPFFKRNESNEMTINTISVKQFRELPHINVVELSAKQAFQQRKALIQACTDITESEFNSLSAPDFNTLASEAQTYILTPADELKGTPLEVKDWSFELLFPFTNEVSEEIKTIRFSVPNVASSELLAEITDDQEREDYMFKVVCGLEHQDMALLSINDYLTLKPRVGDFFLQSGDYFRPMTFRA
ncbi:phage tail assembly protein [Vibrio sp. S17_S38]|uniref:phage tail assembly protein n=1 Tax=Vibrio sp. S17_S38 TaxID=2720229 RepID=UPI0016810ACC|nr:phage tail assembly protein [Vibrio sp. S17_S38]MBD1572878.1 phage tail assembly protein [Vibrio sp. S17_S38]